MIQAIPNQQEFTYPQVLRIIAEELTTLPPKYFQLLTFIASRTFRFGKAEERMTLTHFIDGIETDKGWIQKPVGMAKNAISRGLQEMEDAGIITVVKCRNNVKKIGISLAMLAEGEAEMASRLRKGKEAKKQESNPTVSPKEVDQSPQYGDTSIPNMVTPNISFRSVKSLDSNNGVDTLRANAEKAKEKSKATRQRKADRMPIHKLGLQVFSTYLKENYPTLKLISPTPTAIRNMRLATQGLSRDQVTQFATSTAENWKGIIVHQLAYMHKKDSNLHVAPCINTFGTSAAKFLAAYQREDLKGEQHSTAPQRRRSPVLSLVQDEPAPKRAPKPVYRTQTKAERNQEMGITPVAGKVLSKTEQQRRSEENKKNFDVLVHARMDSTGEDYETAANIIAFGD